MINYQLCLGFRAPCFSLKDEKMSALRRKRHTDTSRNIRHFVNSVKQLSSGKTQQTDI